MRRPLPPLVAAAVLGSVAPMAAAQDLSVRGFLSQRFETTGNPDLGSGGVLYGSVTDVGASFEVRSSTTVWTLAPGVRGSLYGGSADDGSYDDVNFRFNASVNHDGPRSNTSASLSFVPSRTDFTEFDQGNQLTRGSTRLLYSGSFQHLQRIDADDSLTANLFFRYSDYTDSGQGLDPTLSIGGGAGWRRTLDALTTIGLDATVTRFTEDSPENAESISYELRGTAERLVSPRLSLDGSLGLAVVDSERDRILPGGGTTRDSDLTPSVVGNLGLAYTTRDTRYTLSIAQTVDQNDDGEVESRLSLGGGAIHRVNSRSQAGITGRLGFQNPLFDTQGSTTSDRVTLTVSPTYTLSLTPDWDASLGYALRVQDDNGVEASHQVFLQFSRGLSFLP